MHQTEGLATMLGPQRDQHAQRGLAAAGVVHGGARKAPSEWPYITDWTCSSNGAWTNIIIESIFGVRATLNNGISATPQFGKFDREAVLSNLRYQGKSYTVTRRGIID